MPKGSSDGGRIEFRRRLVLLLTNPAFLTNGVRRLKKKEKEEGASPRRKEEESGRMATSGRYLLRRQSSLAPADGNNSGSFHAGNQGGNDSETLPEVWDKTLQLLFLANKGDLEGITSLLDGGLNANSKDFDDRTALHVAACEGNTEVVDLLVRRGADVNATDRWGSTPLADAFCYQNFDVCKFLKAHGAKMPENGHEASMRVLNPSQIPEYEVNPKELDFTNSREVTKSICTAKWRGLNVAVKILKENYVDGQDQLSAFRAELALLLKIRHPNLVQFLGAVTQSSPMMIIFEDLETELLEYLKQKRRLSAQKVLSLALDIARGMNYLHEYTSEVIIHRDLKPKNILLDGSGHVKVTNFGLSKMLRIRKGEKVQMDDDGTSYRYMAPELYGHIAHDRAVDVFSFGLIVQEMINGCQPFEEKTSWEAAEAYLEGLRPPFKTSSGWRCPAQLKRLIERCWHEDPQQRPDFTTIIDELDDIKSSRLETKLRNFFASYCACITTS